MQRSRNLLASQVADYGQDMNFASGWGFWLIQTLGSVAQDLEAQQGPFARQSEVWLPHWSTNNK